MHRTGWWSTRPTFRSRCTWAGAIGRTSLERMDRLLSLWKGNEERLASLDMSFRDQVVARLRRVQR